MPEDKYFTYVKSHLTDLITEYIKNDWWISFNFSFINSKWNIVELQDKSDWDMDYSIHRSVTDFINFVNEYEWWVIIFQLEDDYSYRDQEEYNYYREDYNDYLKDKDKYIKDKVNYILTLTWNIW